MAIMRASRLNLVALAIIVVASSVTALVHVARQKQIEKTEASRDECHARLDRMMSDLLDKYRGRFPATLPSEDDLACPLDQKPYRYEVSAKSEFTISCESHHLRRRYIIPPPGVTP